MNIKLIKKLNSKLCDDEVKIILEYKKENNMISNLEEYIKNYNLNNNTIIVEDYYNKSIPLLKKDILSFYSINKSNYCKTMNNEYKIFSKLYEIEKLDKDFLRISKNCIVNTLHIICFDMNYSR